MRVPHGQVLQTCPDVDCVSWTQTLPTCNHGPTAVSKKPGQVRLHHWKSTSHYQEHTVRAGQRGSEASTSYQRQTTLIYLKAICICSPTSTKHVYARIHRQKYPMHSAGCETFFLLLIQNDGGNMAVNFTHRRHSGTL